MRATPRTIAAIAITAALGLSLAAGSAPASGREGRHAGEERDDRYSETKIYGIVERMPQEEIGVWIVNGREIVVTRDTRIKEKHGKAEVGAYVEVEGNVAGKALTAHEIEVKRSR
jgi:hypothetical protein